ncbi:Subtilisin-like protease SBT5-4 [Nymphaea thermarum]|nr:Subtilisin-like protease SBT5-4 [Nymphaea thermarum]
MAVLFLQQYCNNADLQATQSLFMGLLVFNIGWRSGALSRAVAFEEETVASRAALVLRCVIVVAATSAYKLTAEDYCRPGTLDPKKVKGKIIACVTNFFEPTISAGYVVKEAGGIGMILCKDKNSENFTTETQLHVLPATVLSANDSKEISILPSRSPVAYVGRPITKFHTATAPVMAFFSAGGPNPVNPEILKPDITAPGFEILASNPPFLPATTYGDIDRRYVNFTVVRGTSFSSPHVAGIVGLLKNAHPDWSPAAIKSAIMTTDLNYPSITIPNLNGTKTVFRTVKNVGEPGTYTALTDAPPGTVVSVRPRRLKFDKIGEEKNFTVTVKAKKGSTHKGYVFGWVNWSDGVHHVRSPITAGIGSN